LVSEASRQYYGVSSILDLQMQRKYHIVPRKYDYRKMKATTGNMSVGRGLYVRYAANAEMVALLLGDKRARLGDG
jgi:hypothetical protein